jgi:hypothetical protein
MAILSVPGVSGDPPAERRLVITPLYASVVRPLSRGLNFQ